MAVNGCVPLETWTVAVAGETVTIVAPEGDFGSADDEELPEEQPQSADTNKAHTTIGRNVQ